MANNPSESQADAVAAALVIALFVGIASALFMVLAEIGRIHGDLLGTPLFRKLVACDAVFLGASLVACALARYPAHLYDALVIEAWSSFGYVITAVALHRHAEIYLGPPVPDHDELDRYLTDWSGR